MKNLLRKEEATAGLVTSQISGYPNTSTEVSSPDSDLEFVASAKDRVRKLEQEAENLEKAFQNYHPRVRLCPAKSLVAVRSSPTLYLPGTLKNITAAAPERCVFVDNRVTSQQPPVNTCGGDKSVVSEVPSSMASTSRKSAVSRWLSSTLLPNARSHDSEMYLEGELWTQACGYSGQGSLCSSSPHLWIRVQLEVQGVMGASELQATGEQGVPPR